MDKSSEKTSPRRLQARFGLPLVYEAFGVRFAIRMAGANAEKRLAPYLPRECVRVEDAAPANVVCFGIRKRPDGLRWRLLRNKTVLRETRTLIAALQSLRGALVNYIGSQTRERVFVHAGAVGWKGRAIVMPGNSYAGKSSLVAALLQAGATYYSDELALLDEEGRLHPYARLLQLRDRRSGVQKARTAAQVAGARTPIGEGPIPVGMVVFSQFSESAPWKIQELTPGMAVIEGMRHTLNARTAPPRALQAWARAVDGAMAWKWRRGEAEIAAQHLLKAMEMGTIPA